MAIRKFIKVMIIAYGIVFYAFIISFIIFNEKYTQAQQRIIEQNFSCTKFAPPNSINITILNETFEECPQFAKNCNRTTFK